MRMQLQLGLCPRVAQARWEQRQVTFRVVSKAPKLNSPANPKRATSRSARVSWRSVEQLTVED